MNMIRMENDGKVIRLSRKQAGHLDLVCALKREYPHAKFITGSPNDLIHDDRGMGNAAEKSGGAAAASVDKHIDAAGANADC